MASLSNFVTAEEIKAAMKGVGPGPLTDAEIDSLISDNEAIVRAHMRIGTGGRTLVFTNTNPEHVLIRAWVKNLTILDVIAAISPSFLSLSQASLAADIASDKVDEIKALFKTPVDSSTWVVES